VGGVATLARVSVGVLQLALVVALAAALRSTWSPCGLSMLSTVTPMAEKARGHRYWVTATWFVLGAVVGGATLGAGAAGLAALAGALDLSGDLLPALVAGLAALAAMVDAGVLGRKPPFFKRQVDDAWLAKYRAWVYGSGFGWQIGAGLTTYIMTAGVLLTVALAVLTQSPLQAFAVCVAFGFARGLVVLLGAGLRSPAALGALHQRLDALEAPVRWAVVAVQAAVAVFVLVTHARSGAAVGVVAACVLALAVRLPLGLRAESPTGPAAPSATPSTTA